MTWLIISQMDTSIVSPKTRGLVETYASTTPGDSIPDHRVGYYNRNVDQKSNYVFLEKFRDL